MLNNKKAAIFDLDGTLVDSMYVWGDIDVEYLGRFGLEVPEDLQRSVEGLSFSEVAVYFKERFGLEDSLEKIKQDWNDMAMLKYSTQIPLKEGVREVLQKMRQRGMRLGIASSNSPELVRAVLAANEVLSHFSCILTCCEVEKGKPEPDVYLETARRLEVPPSECIVFEDLPVGLMAGRAAGMTTCAVEDSYSASCREEKKRLADYYISSYQDILGGRFEEL